MYGRADIGAKELQMHMVWAVALCFVALVFSLTVMVVA